MAEKLTRKEKIAQQQKSAGPSAKQIQQLEKKKSRVTLILGVLIAIAGFLVYSNTLQHEYVLDDYGLIRDNTQTKKGISAIPDIFAKSYRYGMNITDFSLYRPVTKAMFAAEWDISPNDPPLGHWINVLFFAFSCFVLFIVLSKYMKGNLVVPFVTALLFAVHPLHTEVVANIKSRDEIVSFLLLLSSLFYFHRYINGKNISMKRAAWKIPVSILLLLLYFSGAATGIVGLLLVAVSFVLLFTGNSFVAATFAYLLAMFTKESSITFLAVIPLMFYFFTNATKQQYIKSISAIVGCVVFFLIIRGLVLEDVKTLIPMEDNSLVAIKNVIVQRANAIYILGIYLYKMIWPMPLMSDASYNTFPPVGLLSLQFLIPFLLMLGGGIYAILNFKKKDPIAFAILYFFITISLVSNVVILIGTNYGERLTYVPSLGIMMIVAILLTKAFKLTESKTFDDLGTFFKTNSKPIAVAVVLSVFFGYTAMARNVDWKDNLSLYMGDIEKVPNSAHMLFYMANHITSEEYLAAQPDSATRDSLRNKSIEFLTRAVNIYPKYADGYQRRGFVYNQLGNYEKAEKDYKAALESNPSHPIVYNNYGTLCFTLGRYDESMNYFEKAITYNPRYAHALNNLASVYGTLGQQEQRLMNSDPANFATHQQKAANHFQTAIVYFLKSIDADPEFGEPYRLAAMTYRNLGDNINADRYDRMYNELLKEKNAQN